MLTSAIPTPENNPSSDASPSSTDSSISEPFNPFALLDTMATDSGPNSAIRRSRVLRSVRRGDTPLNEDTHKYKRGVELGLGHFSGVEDRGRHITERGSGKWMAERMGKRQDQATSEGAGEGQGGTKTLSVETQTVELENGASLPTSLFEDPTGGQAQLKLSMMWETTNEFETSVGKMTEKCLIPADDPSQRFCETLLDGEILGGTGDAVPLAAASASASPASTTAETSVTAIATATEAGITSSPASEGTSVTAESALSPAETSSSGESPSASSAGVEGTASASGSYVPPTTLSDVPTSTDNVQATISPTDSVAASLTASAASADSAITGTPVINFTVQPIASDTASTAAAAAASEDAATVSIPGQQLQVLPIGLGVFGGLAGIAILVVLYVTYQRRKFKLQFRSRKLAETAAPMGTGGSYGSA
ncbi:uncharacterized protein I303_102674 [Kwoniella dejecticola CBS 10117]|uniref:Uncharacterized protein n=1 Tax=Kwoniella dejecticola CBS 10117 TaxID=1296121 RepID=A0A1A6A9F3_9TREE|nr:uncharacterized protein I303_02689 [Kwoniella dejecticola CBS 10117]OBR86678.1 hypothetical protein I303_02689 [Kwoniella dejecticola CBS 10117]